MIETRIVIDILVVVADLLRNEDNCSTLVWLPFTPDDFVAVDALWRCPTARTTEQVWQAGALVLGLFNDNVSNNWGTVLISLTLKLELCYLWTYVKCSQLSFQVFEVRHIWRSTTRSVGNHTCTSPPKILKYYSQSIQGPSKGQVLTLIFFVRKSIMVTSHQKAWENVKTPHTCGC